MQCSGMPRKLPQEGKAVLPTFQITAFSTGLKNHVMVMDLVKSNWFPSQRRAKVCVIRMCPGLKVAQQPASRYEIHSRLFSSPKDDSAWERNESLSKAGLLDKQYSTNDQIALRNFQSAGTERKLDFTKGTLASQNRKMISSIVFSHLIDEKKSKENGATMPLTRANAQPPSPSLKPASARRSGVNITGSLAVSPDRLGILTLPDERGLETEPLSTQANLDRGPYKGFSSITITARRVGPPASTLVWDTVRDPLCPKCRAKNVPHQGPPALAAAAHQCQASGHFAYSDFPSNGSIVRLKMREPHTGLCAGQEYWVTRMDEKEDSLSPDTPPSGKSSLVFSSCVHFQVSQQCPNAIYYLDKALSVPLEQPQTASPQMHRSVLSLNLRCSSHRLTADGVDSIANREPINRALKPELLKGRQDLQGPRWSPLSQGNHWKESPALKPVHLGSGTCPWTGSPSLENAQFVDGGSNQVTVRKEKEDRVACPTSRRADQLSIHIPGWSYRADYTCCDLVVKLQECKKHEDPDTTPEPLPAPTSPAVSEEPQSSDLLEDRPEPQHPLASFMTLQEALEVHKPQFISRSQERLKKLKQMVQQRQTQQKEGQKQSPLPIRANRKQFTVPHPLSDNLFKPKERCISEKEMHMRSKRIYNNLPEVKKKKEEQKKRIILQSNRLRAEVFKKQLLDQLLQRNAV